MNVLYLILCALLGFFCCMVLCGAAGGSGRVFASPEGDIPKGSYLPGNLAAPFALAVCTALTTAINAKWMALPIEKSEILHLTVGLCFILMLSLLGLADDCIRIFVSSPVGVPFVWRQVIILVLCGIYVWVTAGINGSTVLILPFGNVNPGVWYYPLCTLLAMIMLLGAQMLIKHQSSLCIGVLGTAAGVLPLFGKLQQGSPALFAAVCAGMCVGLFIHSYPTPRIYMGSCSALCLGGTAAVLSVGSFPLCSSISALPIAAAGIVSAAAMLYPRHKTVKKLQKCSDHTYIRLCMAGSLVGVMLCTVWAFFL